ncbi:MULTISPECIES: hypothetical protein [Polymorphospora]|uniref:HhH-GPD domain-containing protein n=1 Tax=Polymorphospora lycopeni TaxID=3140240 RepID=A0ABV5CTL5_9ACTN
MSADRVRVRALLDRHGRLYAEEAGIRLADAPGPLYQLLVLATLLSTRIRAGVATAAARELFAAGLRTPKDMAAARRPDLIAALGRGHYRRYDERTATMLAEEARLCLDRWRGDLRRLHAEAAGDLSRTRKLLTEFPGIGPTGADIYLREAQAVWDDVRPYADRRVAAGADRVGLPSAPDALAGLVPGRDFARLTAALVRVALDPDSAGDVVAAR